MAVGITEINSAADFQTQISCGKLVVVDFHATWCGPCRFIAPKIAEFAKQYPEAVFVKVDVDAVAEVAAKYEVSAMPTFQFFKDGKKIDEVVGADAAKVEAAIKKHLNK